MGTLGPWVGTRGPWAGTRGPLALRRGPGGWSGPQACGSSPRRPPADCPDPGSPPPPPEPHPCKGGAAHTCGSSPRRPLTQHTGSAGRKESGWAPHCPQRPPPPPTTTGAIGLTAPGGLLCRGGEVTGRFVPAPNGGLYPRHRAHTLVGGCHPTPPTLHRTHRKEGSAPGNGLTQAEGRCQPPGPPGPPASSSLSSPLAAPAHSPRGG